MTTIACKTHQKFLNSTAITKFGRASAFAVLSVLTATSPVLADGIDPGTLPMGGTVASGSASFVYGQNILNINQDTNRVVIDWNSFNIGANATTQFNQNSSSAIAVNRVHDVNPSQILGNLRANGKIVLLNQNGVFFGSNSHVDVAGMLASTGKINADEFMDTGRINLSSINNNPNAKIQNDGTINIANSGLAAFVGPNVINNGVITARLGKIALASGGDRATVDMYGDGLVEMALDANASKALITNNGTLKADGGVIAITAKAAQGIVGSVVNMGGIVEANTVGVKNGRIILGATNADVNVTGKVNAKGGNGRVDIRSTDNITVTADAEINVDAGLTGNGGLVNVIAQRSLAFLGTIFARGGATGGDGGFVDTSGMEELNIDGKVDASAANGKSGTWLIDPRNLWIGTYGSYGNVNLFTSRANIANVITALNSGTNVSLTTVGGGGIGDGDIIIDGTITKTAGSNALLTLTAVDDIYFESGSGISSTAGALSLAFNAGGDITINRAITTNGGSVNFDAGDDISIESNINTGGGTATFRADDQFHVDSGRSVTTGGGSLAVFADAFDLDGTMNAGAGSITIAREDDTGRISIGDANGGMEISQAELNRMTAGSLNFGQSGFGSHDNDIMVEDADLDAFATVTLRTRRDDSSSSQDVVFDGTNYVANLNVFSDDEVELDNNARLSSIGDITLTGNTNGLSSGNFHMDNGSRIDTNGHNLMTVALNTIIDDDAYITAEGGNISLFSNGTFYSDDANSVRTSGHGTITINQNVGGSIQNAIDAVQNTGDGLNTINVGAGTFHESVNVYEDNFVLNGAANHATVIDPNSPGFNVTGNNATINGFTITGTSGADGFGIFVNGGNNATLQNNVINNTSANAIQIVNSNGTHVLNNFIGYTNPTTVGAVQNIHGDGIYASNTNGLVVTGNKITRTKSMAWDNGSGIQVVGSAIATVGGVGALGNTIFDTGWDGVRVAGSSTVMVQGNDIDDVARTGIYFGGANGATASGNNIDGTGSHYGIDVSGGGAITLDGNTILDTNLDGIRANAVTSLQITNNDIGVGGAAGNIGVNGIYVSNSDDAQVNDNEIENASANGIYATLSSGLYVLRNRVLGAILDGIRVDGGNTATVNNNNVSDSGDDGIDVSGVVSSLIDNNTVSNSDDDGIVVTGMPFFGPGDALVPVPMFSTSTVITNNDVTFSGNNGIESAAVNTSYIGDNTVNYSGHDGIFVRGDYDRIGGGPIYMMDPFGSYYTTTIVDNQIGNSSNNGISVQLMNSAYIGYAGLSTTDGETTVPVGLEQGNHITASGNNGIAVGDVFTSHIENNSVGAGLVTMLSVVEEEPFTGSENNGIFVTDYINDFGFGDEEEPPVILGLGVPMMGSGYYETTINNNFVDNSGWDGIHVEGMNYSLVDTNSVYNSGHDGIFAYGGHDRFIFEDDLMDRSLEEGGYGYYTDIVGNTVDNSGNNGISAQLLNGAYIGYSAPIVIGDALVPVMGQGNNVTNSGFGFSEGGGNGIAVGDVFSSTIEGNSVDQSSNNGIMVTNYINDYNVEGGPVLYGMVMDYPMFATYTTDIMDNTVDNSGNNGIAVYDINDSYIGDGEDEGTVGNLVSNSGWDGIQVYGDANWMSGYGGGSSYPVYDIWTPASFSTIISDNVVTDSYDDGIDVGYLDSADILRNDISNQGAGEKDGGYTGIEANVIDELLIQDNTIDTIYEGINLYNNNQAVLEGNEITNAFYTGIYVGGAYNQSVVLRDNNVQSQWDGAWFQSGAIDFQGVNFFDSLNDGLVFDPGRYEEGFADRSDILSEDPLFSNLSVVGNTFGTTVFENQEGFYIRLANGALFDPGQPTILDARFSTFDGYTPNSFVLPFAQYVALEEKLWDFDDDQTLGQIFFTFLGGVDSRLFDIDQLPGGPGGPGGGSVTILGLPGTGGAGGGLNNIAPAAGGEAGDLNDLETAAGGDPEALNEIATAAGGEEVSCWGSVTNAQSAVTYNLSEDPSALLSDQVNCQQNTGSSL